MRPYSEYEAPENKKFQITRGMVILAALVFIIVIVVIVMIVNASNKKRENEYLTEDFKKLEQRMLDEAPIYIAQKQILLTDKEIKINLSDLLVQNGGAIDSSKIKAAKICDGYVIAAKQETEKYSSYIKCGDKYTTYGYVSNDIKVPTTTKKEEKDTTKPYIVLKGEKEININVGQKFDDPGFNATDNFDGDITSKVIKEGSVDINKAGVYTILYKVSDNAGNTAEEKRIVKVIAASTTTTKVPTTTKKNTTTTKRQTTTKQATKPTTPPTISLYGNKTITLNIGESYNDPGYSAYDSLGTNITSSVKISSNVNTSISGTYYVTYSVSDRYGNNASINRIVVVKSASITLKGITISPNTIELNRGTSKSLTVYYTPNNATDKSLTWTSSNPSVAQVSNGTVYAKARGAATITAKSSNGKTASVKVTVK